MNELINNKETQIVGTGQVQSDLIVMHDLE
jgi:hypothetical protein